MRTTRTLVYVAAIAAAACNTNPDRSPVAPSVITATAARPLAATTAAVLPPPDPLQFSFEGRGSANDRTSSRGIPRSLSVRWRAVPGATGYRFEIGSSKGATDRGTTQKAAHETTHDIPLEPERPIWARIRTVNADGPGAASREIIISWRNGRPLLDLDPMPDGPREPRPPGE